ncbi:MAG: PAS domain-containing protein [Rhizobiaceae bacterium]|nr:PAS domain-containing protein [Rhizobiaceae bacterium]
MDDAASFDAILQCNLLEVFCEALGAAIFVTDKFDEISFASIRLLHLFPIRESAIAPGGRARDLYGALYDAGIRFGGSDRPAGGGREEWIAERIACAWRERVDKIEQTGPERWMRIVSRRFSSGLGFVVIQDVSEQRKKENLLRNEQERVKLTEEILDTLPVAVAVKDRNLNYVAVNQEFCRLLGRPQDAIVGRGSWDALTPDLAGRIEQMDWQLLSSGEPSVAEIHFVRPDGKALFIERRARRLGKPGSHFIAISLFEETQGAAGDRDAASPLGASPQGRAAMVPPPLTPPDPVCNALLLTDRREPGQALKLALRAHGVDLCYIRDVPEFAAFLPAARAAGLTVDLILIDFDFDPMAFNVAAASGLHFRMLPKDAGDSAILAEILGVLPQASARRDEEETAELRLAAAEVFDDASAIEAVDIRLDILAVEDNPINRMVLEQMLGNLELTFHIAGTAAEGLDDCAAFSPRIVLSDTTLPDMAADEFASRLRRIDPSQILVALVPADTEEDHRRAKAAGFDGSLSKPLSAEALGKLVCGTLSGHTEQGCAEHRVPGLRQPNVNV